MRLHEIGQFYGERKGWRMFDRQFLTQEVATYLLEEEQFLRRVTETGYSQLIEVGCGYGRYLKWALSNDLDYVGLDIVPWLVELGQTRLSRIQEYFPSSLAKILLHPAEKITEVASNEVETLAFFPFNCLGNVSQFEAALDSLKDSKIDVVISTFKTDATSTKIRKQYYEKCGYDRLNSRIMKQGLLIISDEGFHAMAYYQKWLASAFEKRGFELVETFESSSVGSLYYFRHGKRSLVDDSQEKANVDSEHESILFVLKDDLSGAERGELLQFQEVGARLKATSNNRLTGTSSMHLEPGTAIRIALPVVSHAEVQFLDLVGEVITCEPSSDGQPAITLKLNKEIPGLIDRLSGRSS